MVTGVHITRRGADRIQDLKLDTNISRENLLSLTKFILSQNLQIILQQSGLLQFY